jgi:hypothetical protein
VTKKKFAELEFSLLHLQQSVEIPEHALSSIHLSRDPTHGPTGYRGLYTAKYFAHPTETAER